MLLMYPCTIYHISWLAGLYTLFAKSSQVWLEWKGRLEEVIGLRKVVLESNEVFEAETLSVDTFFAPTLLVNAGLSWNNDGNFTGKVTCPVPFSKSPLRVRISCANEGSSFPWQSWSGGHWMCRRNVDQVQAWSTMYCVSPAFHVFSPDPSMCPFSNVMSVASANGNQSVCHAGRL